MVSRSLSIIAATMLVGGSMLSLTTVANAETGSYRTLQLVQRRSRSGRPDWLRSLNLTPEQIQQIQEIRKRYQDRLTAERQAVRQAQQALKQLMASNASTEQMREKFEQLQSLKQKLGDTRMESMLAIRAVLNADQRQRLNEVIRQMGRGRDRLDDL